MLLSASRHKACLQGLRHLLDSPEIAELLTKGAERQMQVGAGAGAVGGVRGLAAAAYANTGEVVRPALAVQCLAAGALTGCTVTWQLRTLLD